MRLLLARCARPTIGKRSTYTVLGFAGYAVATIVGVVLALRWQLALGERAIALIVPPAMFVMTVAIATALKGREWIVFYQALFAAVAGVVVAGLVADARVWRLVDVAVLGIGTFLVLGRIGCFHVACCHGKPARFGVIYGDAHVAAGFWGRLAGRPLVPVQLLESAASALLVGAGLLASATPGTAALVYASGYACVRFALELVRGDPARPYAHGLSEAQWSSLGVAAVAALARPTWWTLAALGAIVLVAAILVGRRRARELLLAPHLGELDRVFGAILADPARGRRDTRLGVGVSCHDLPDGRRDWVMSSAHPAWSATTARRLASALFGDVELVEGRTPGVMHVLESGERRQREAQ